MENYNLAPLDYSEELKRCKRKKAVKDSFKGLGLAILAVILIIAIAMCTAAAPRVAHVYAYDGDNPYITFQTRPLISAHRAGRSLAPENTLKAFETCLTATYTVDVLEFDLHRTKDGKLILLHDDTLNRTSNATQVFGDDEAEASEYTLEQLKRLNMGYNFRASDGSYPYRGLETVPADLQVVTLEEVLTYTETYITEHAMQPLNYIIEIKDGGDAGRRATDILHATLVEKGLLERTVVGTFQGEITRYMDEKYPDFIRSSSIAEVLDFWLAFLFGVDISKRDLGYEVMQIPYKLAIFNLGHESIIDYAHHYGLAVQFWTINDPAEIKLLVERGADCIISDNPEKASQIIIDNGVRRKGMAAA